MKKLVLLLPLMGGALAAQDLRAQAPAATQRTQERTITGRVTGTDGAGIPGVTVLVKGGSRGTATDVDGNYTLAVASTAERLVFSFVGYVSQEQPIGNGNTINVTLTSSTGLDEVVVVGYGVVQSRRESTGSIAVVEGSAIANLPVQSFDQALQGRAAGVNITTPNGLLNNPPVIRIRGINSINLSSQPLVVVDGVPTYTGNNSTLNSVPNNPLANINPDDIENVEVLKDAASTAIYGSRATNGVILVTTKRGRQGQSHVNYSAWGGLTTPVRLYNLLGAEDYMAIKNEAVHNLNINQGRTNANGVFTPGSNREFSFRPSYDINGKLIDTRWYDYVYQTGVATSQSLNFSGGNDKTTYFTSLDYTNQKGMLKRNEFQRYGGRGNIDHKVFSRLTVGVRFNYTYTHNRAPNSGSVSGGAFSTSGLGRLPLVLPPNVAAFNADGSYNTYAAGLGAGANINPTTGAPLYPGYYNPVVDLENNYFTSDAGQIQGSVYGDLEPLKGLHLRSTFGIDNISFEDKAFYTSIAGDAYQTGEADNYYRTNKRWNWQNTASYSHTFGEKHSFDLLVGNEQQVTNQQRWGASRTSIADLFFTNYQGNFTNIAASGNFVSTNYLVSFFGRFAYNYDHKYLLTFNARRDGFSAWANPWGNFYGGSLGYIVSEEGFWKNSGISNTLNFLKVSGSYGSVGNNQGIDDFASLQLYGSGLYGSNATLYYTQAGNPSLRWETSRKTDISLNVGLFQDRLTGEFTYYRNFIDGLILPVPVAPSLGIPNGGPGSFATSIPGNAGSMVNKGVEISLRYAAIKHKNFSWTVSGNITTLSNEVLSLVEGLPYVSGSTSGLETVNYTTVGRSIGSILAVPSLGVNPENGRRMVQLANGTVVQYQYGGSGWTTLDNKSGSQYTPSQITDGQYYGPVLPTWYGGFDNTFTLGNFDLGVFIQFSGGNYIYNGTKAGLHDQRFWNNAADIKNHWTPENRNALYPAVVYGDNVSNGSALVMSSNIEKGDFARLRNVQLGYTLKSSMLSKAKMASARFYVQVQNALLVTKYSGIDPEISSNGSSNTSPGVDRNSVGQARTYTAGLSVGF